MLEPTTLHKARVGWPLRFDSRRAASVSAVSPDCVIAMIMVLRSIGGVPEPDPLADPTPAGERAGGPSQDPPAHPAGQPVPPAPRMGELARPPRLLGRL